MALGSKIENMACGVRIVHICSSHPLKTALQSKQGELREGDMETFSWCLNQIQKCSCTLCNFHIQICLFSKYMVKKYLYKIYKSSLKLKLDKEAPIMTDPPPTRSTTELCPSLPPPQK